MPPYFVLRSYRFKRSRHSRCWPQASIHILPPQLRQRRLIDSKPDIWTSTTILEASGHSTHIPELFITASHESCSRAPTKLPRTEGYDRLPGVETAEVPTYLPTLPTYLPWISQINGICAWTTKTISLQGIDGNNFGT